MDIEQVLNVGIALALIAGIGVAGSTMESAVKTTPDDAIDIDASAVPLGSGELETYKERLQSGDGGAKSADRDGERASSSSSGASERDPIHQAGDAGDGDADRLRPDESANSGSGAAGGHRTLLDRLLSLLRALLDALLTLLPVLVALAALVGAVVNRDRIAALIGRTTDSATGRGATDTSSGRAAPTNAIAEAWYEMVTLVGPDRPETTTPRESLALAVDAGADRSAVERVVESFEEVRYGHADVTEERQRRALDGLSAVRTQLQGDR